MKKHLFCYTFSSLVAAALFVGCGNNNTAKEENTATETNPPPAANNVDYLGAMGQAQKQATKVIDISTIQEAINLFHAEEDRYPESLEELVTSGTYLPSLPELPKGLTYSYSPKTGKVKVVPVPQAPPAPPVPPAAQ